MAVGRGGCSTLARLAVVKRTPAALEARLPEIRLEFVAGTDDHHVISHRYIVHVLHIFVEDPVHRHVRIAERKKLKFFPGGGMAYGWVGWVGEDRRIHGRLVTREAREPV